MGWSGSLTASSAIGASITYTPDTSNERGYTIGAFTAPKNGIYQFILKGSGGTAQHAWSQSGTPGAGGKTIGYLLLNAGQTVYVGAGGTCSAAFVSKVNGAALKNIAKENLYFVAGAGGGNGNSGDGRGGNGGNGGGITGANGSSNAGTYMGYGGTQTAAGQGNSGYGEQGGYGYGGNGEYGNNGHSLWRGNGGDGLYGGGAGGFCNGGAGGSGYIHTSSFTIGSATYTNSTSQGGGANGGARGSVIVTYYARTSLPIIFNGTTLERLIFNGVEIESVIYNGTKLFIRSIGKEIRKLLNMFKLNKISALQGGAS